MLKVRSFHKNVIIVCVTFEKMVTVATLPKLFLKMFRATVNQINLVKSQKPKTNN